MPVCRHKRYNDIIWDCVTLYQFFFKDDMDDISIVYVLRDDYNERLKATFVDLRPSNWIKYGETKSDYRYFRKPVP
jgi:hypothetical protein